MVGVAAPQAVLADVAPGGRELVDAVLVKARLVADGARVHDVAHGKAQAKERLREPLRAAAAVVERQARIDRQQHARDVLRPLLVEAALVQAIARELADGLRELAGGATHRGKVRRLAPVALGRGCGQRVLLGALQYGYGGVVLQVRVGGGQLRREVVLHDVVHQPLGHVAVHAGVKLVVRLPERLDGIEGLATGLHTNAHEQLVEVDVGKRGRRLLHLSRAHACPPREVAAQLAVGHGAVRGVVALELPVVGTVVLKVLHEAGLLVEEARLGPGAAARRALQLAHLADLLGQVAVHLRAAADDWLVGVRLGGGEGL